MGQEYTAKSFRSGNSVAIRIPAALRVEPNEEWLVSQEDGELHLRPKPEPKKYIDVSGFAGKAPGIKLIPREDFDERPSAIASRDMGRDTGRED